MSDSKGGDDPSTANAQGYLRPEFSWKELMQRVPKLDEDAGE